MPRPGAHRRPAGTRPLWPRSDWSRRLVVRGVALYAALLVSVSYDERSLGPVGAGAAITTLVVGAALRTEVPASLVRLAQRATSLILLLLTATLLSRQESVSAAVAALVLSLGALWWVEEDERRRATTEESSWRTMLLDELRALRHPHDVAGPRLGLTNSPYLPRPRHSGSEGRPASSVGSG